MARLSVQALLWGMSLCLLTESESAEPQRLALVIGVREYPASDKLTPLEFTEPDAGGIAAALQRGGFKVTLMTQQASEGKDQKRFAPNAAFIRRQFADLVAAPFLGKEDCLMVVLEGHGIQLPARANPQQQTFYFCPADAVIDVLQFSDEVNNGHNLIPVQELYDTLQKSSAGVKLLVVDACRNDPNKPGAFRSPNSVTRPPLPVPPGGMAALFSCSASQRAAEDPELKHGVFSHFLIEALSGKADLDGDEQIDLTELHKYVSGQTFEHVRRKYSTQQLPEFRGDIKGWAPLMPVPPDPLIGIKAGQLWEANSLGMKFRWCPPGEFTMGSPVSEPNHRDNEQSVHVKLTRGFWIAQYEVTMREWRQMMGTSARQLGEKGALTKGPAGAGPHYPMYLMGWGESMRFCQALTEQEVKAGRIPENWRFTLPTEAQWEYACRAGTKTATAFGDRLSSKQANFDGDSPYNGGDKGPNHQRTVPVGSYQPNAWTIHDMHGNVWEYCLDGYVDELPGGTDPKGILDRRQRTLRGGSWKTPGESCRSAQRLRCSLGDRANGVGFRVVLVRVN